MENDMILSVNSPRDGVGGPYAVVYKDDRELWAIVALDWYENPTLGMRWFPSPEDKGKGYPTAAGRPVWFIIPGPLHRAILAGLPLDTTTYYHVLQFLTGTISGEQLQESIPFS